MLKSDSKSLLIINSLRPPELQVKMSLIWVDIGIIRLVILTFFGPCFQAKMLQQQQQKELEKKEAELQRYMMFAFHLMSFFFTFTNWVQSIIIFYPLFKLLCSHLYFLPFGVVYVMVFWSAILSLLNEKNIRIRVLVILLLCQILCMSGNRKWEICQICLSHGLLF